MTELLLSVLCSSSIFVIFKLFTRFKVDTFQAIVFNYLTAFGIGIVLYGNEWKPQALEQTDWIPYAVGTGLLFISLFFVMARSSQINGVGSTSVAVKMSMAVSLVLMILIYSESVGWMKIAGIALAFIGVYLVSSGGGSGSRSKGIWMLFLLFIGSGALDFALNYVQNYHLKHLTASLFSAFGLGCAGVVGLVILIIQILAKKSKIQFKNLSAGLILGVPNYFSIYLLIKSYKTTGWNDSTVLAITNVSVVLLTGLIGFVLFKESMKGHRIIGFISAIFAILLLYYANLNA